MEKHLFLQLITKALGTFIGISLLLFVPAGTFDYPEAWTFLGSLFVFAVAFSLWLKIKYPHQFYNRMHPHEPDCKQLVIVRIIGCILCFSLILSGIDKRYSWSHLPETRYIFALGLLIAAATIYRNVFMVNPFLSNTVIIHERQTIIQEGMYKIVRHPMYLASLLVYIAGLIMLGSLLSLPLCCLFYYMLLSRAKGEEIQLMDALPEYKEYMIRVRYRIIPFVH